MTDTASVTSASELEPLTVATDAAATKRTPSTVAATVVCTVVWLALATAMPFYNKATFSAYLPQGHKPEATLTPTLIQMIGASGLLILCELLRHAWLVTRERRRTHSSIDGGTGAHEGDHLVAAAVPPHSWLFGAGFLRKLLYMALPALFYTGVMATTNSSLQMTSVNLHVILRMTTIVWVVLLALLVQRERPTLIALLCCAGLAVGTVLSSLSYKSPFGDQVGPILLTLLSSLLQGCMIVSTRMALTSLSASLSPLEAVALKMCVATLLLTPIALGLDVGGWALLAGSSAKARALVGCGVLVTALFASLQVALQSLTGAIAVGVLGLCVIIPQVVLSLLIETVPVDALHVAGYVINPVFATVYAAERLYINMVA